MSIRLQCDSRWPATDWETKNSDLSQSNFVQPQSFRSWGVQLLQKTVCSIHIEYIQLCAVTVHKLQFQNKWQSCQPISHLDFFNSLLTCLVMGCLKGGYRGTQECHKVASLKYSIVLGRPEVPHGHRLRMTTPREDTFSWNNSTNTTLGTRISMGISVSEAHDAHNSLIWRH